MKKQSDDIVKAFEQVVQAAVEQGSIEGLDLAGEVIKNRSSKSAPLDTGKLKLSIYKKLHVYKWRNKVTVEIGSMGAKDPDNGYMYAVIQHENPSFKHPRGGRWKYIENSAYESVSNIRRHVVGRIKANLKTLASKRKPKQKKK